MKIGMGKRDRTRMAVRPDMAAKTPIIIRMDMKGRIKRIIMPMGRTSRRRTARASRMAHTAFMKGQ